MVATRPLTSAQTLGIPGGVARQDDVTALQVQMSTGATVPALNMRTTALELNAQQRAAASRRAKDLTGSNLASYTTLAERVRGGTIGASTGYLGVAVGLEVGADNVPVDVVVDRIGTDVGVASTATFVRWTVYARLTAGASIDLTPGQSDDVLLAQWDTPLADLGLTAGGSVVAVTTPLPDPLLTKAGTTYVLVAEARDGSGNLVGTGFGIGTASGQPQHRRGWYRNSGGGWSADDANTWTSWSLRQAVLTNVPALASRTSNVEAAQAAISAQFTASLSTIGLRTGVNTYPSNINFGDWAVGALAGTDLIIGQSITALAAVLQVGATTSTIRTRLWSRPASSAASTAGPGSAGDTLLADVSLTPAAAGLTIGTFGRMVVTLPAAVQVAASTIYIVETDALASDGTHAGLGIGYASITRTDPYTRGWYRSGQGNFGTVNSGLGLAYEFLATRYTLITPDAALATRDLVTACAASSSGLTVTVPIGTASYSRNGTATPFGGSVTLATPTTGTVTGEARTLSYPTTAYYAAVPSAGKLANANVSAVTVKDAGTGAVLVSGTDYVLDPVLGTVVLPSSGTSRAVTVDYTWSRRRYDLVTLNPETGALAVVQGTERDRDAAEFLPARNDPTQIPLYSARVTALGVDLIPVWDVDNGVRRGLAREVDLAQRQAAQALRAFRKKLRAGQPVTIAMYSDSTGAVGGGGAQASTTPNGTSRDIPNYFGPSETIQADVINALPKYDFGDGGGAIHVKASQAWTMIGALTAEWSSSVTYLNFGVNGSYSGTGTGNGRDPDHLAALTSSAADLVIVNYGMNELGSGSTEANVVAIVQAIQASGKAALVLGTARPNARATALPYASWLKTQRALQRAASYTGAAYLDTVMLCAEEHLGAIGVTGNDICAVNFTNHPGVFEHKIWGSALARLILGE